MRLRGALTQLEAAVIGGTFPAWRAMALSPFLTAPVIDDNAN